MFEDNPKKWTQEFFEKMQQTADPLADSVVDAIFAEGSLESVNRTLVELTQNDQEIPASLPKAVHDYFEESAILPEWADPRVIKIGEDLFTDYGMMAFSILGCASLPECYACSSGAKVLAFTTQLEEHVNRRIIETFLMLVDVMRVGGLSPKGKGIRSAQKVRLMHAAIRHLILTPPPNHAGNGSSKTFCETLINCHWNQERDGLPINQATMGFTYLTFTYVILRSLSRLAIDVKEERQNAYFHCWNVVSHIMGVDSAFYVNNMKDAKHLWAFLRERLRAPSPEGVQLNTALMDYMADQIRTRAPLGRFMPTKHIPRLLTVELIGSGTGKSLGIKLSALDRVGKFILAFYMHLLGTVEKKIYADLPFGHRIAQWIFRLLAKSEIKRGGTRPPYEIPDELREAWELD